MNKIVSFLNTEKMVKNSFYLTYVFLLTTATITFIEAMRTKNNKVRHILNLETCISVVAAYFYGKFVEQIDVKNINYRKINMTRYVDWFITTPIMLLVLCLAFLYNTGGKLQFFTFLKILALNFAMLGSGYLGETKYLNRNLSLFIGFVFFFALYGYIYYKFLSKRSIFDNQILYWAFFTFWILYGVVYNLPEKMKNVTFNYLDLFAKCFVGIFFWAYFTGVFTLSKRGV
jgi:bacteriorhodopsin